MNIANMFPVCLTNNIILLKFLSLSIYLSLVAVSAITYNLRNRIMIDLHTHTFLSDGELCPAEHIRWAEIAGYKVLGFADHVDLATIPVTLPILIAAAKKENELGNLRVVAGVELTHVRPAHIAEGTALARSLGAEVVIVHGETIAEAVQPGTNRAAIEAGVDILAHPGLITPEDVALAAERGVRLEITAKPGHALCNGHVAALALKYGAELIFGSDSHSHSQMVEKEYAYKVIAGAGLSEEFANEMFAGAQRFVDSL